MRVMDDIRNYVPGCEQEARDQAQMLAFMAAHPDCLERSCLAGHMTASAWVVNPERTKVLMAYHDLYDAWAWLGGHADGDDNLRAVALREAQEESGIRHAHLASEEIFSIETLTVDGHVKHGVWVPSHLHFNVTFLVEADEDERLTARPGENQAVQWFAFEDAMRASTEKWMVEQVYRKLAARAAALRK
ncbi:MAG: NUDIX hydrolase [Clostridia bacterium]|nr:NUDIX hydrolase [Clostridia bacterium]